MSTTIGGWTVNDKSLQGSNIIISSSGTIQTSDFQSALVGTGRGYKLGADGIAEFEEARIRGTLSTAVFEKETISAVGGAVIIANATAVRSGSLILSQSLLGQVYPSSSIPVDNAAGFAVGEFIVAKAVHDTGFTEETMKIFSSSLVADNHTLFVSRSLKSNNLITSMSSGQALVSLGKKDTGFILLNATSGSETPYIDITERTGSDVNDLDIKVRLGDLSGITDTINGTAVSGFGLYTDNVFLKGGIEATYGSIGGFTIESDKITGTNFTLNPGNKEIILGSGANRVEIDADEGLFAGGTTMAASPLQLHRDGEMTGSAVKFTGGKIANWRISGTALESTNGNVELEAATNGSIRVGGSSAQRIELDGQNGNIKLKNAAGTTKVQIDDEFITAGDDYGGVQITNGLLHIDNNTGNFGSKSEAIKFRFTGLTNMASGVASVTNVATHLQMAYDSSPTSIRTSTMPGSHQAVGFGAAVKAHSVGGIGNVGVAIAIAARATSGEQNYSFYGIDGILENVDEIRSEGDITDNYSSDKRLKDNIYVIGDSISKIKQIRGVEFDWNEKGPDWTRHEYFGNASGSLHDVGVIAQEVQKVLPEAVKKRKNGYLSVSYKKLIPLLIEGIKDQQIVIDNLNKRLEKLEENL